MVAKVLVSDRTRIYILDLDLGILTRFVLGLVPKKVKVLVGGITLALGTQIFGKIKIIIENCYTKQRFQKQFSH